MDTAEQKGLLRRLYDWMMEMAQHRHAVRALFAVSFAESSFFPLPPDIMLIPMVLAKRAKAFVYAAWASVSSVLGGILGYIIGYFLFETVGKPVLGFYGYMEKFDHFAATYNEQGIWIVLAAGLTPLPYKIFTIASGLTGMNFFAFVAASAVARSIRFFAVAGLLYLYGAHIRDFIEKYFGMVTIAFFLLLVGGFMIVKYVL